MYNTYNITQFSILDSHCPGPKQEVGKHNSSMFLPFLLLVMRFGKLNKGPFQIRDPPPAPLYEVPTLNVLKITKSSVGKGLPRRFTVYCQGNPGLFSMGTFDFKRYPPFMAKKAVSSLLIKNLFDTLILSGV